MKHLWVDSGHDPIYEKAAAHGVRGLFFDPPAIGDWGLPG